MSVLKEKLGEAIASVHAVLVSMAQEQAGQQAAYLDQLANDMEKRMAAQEQSQDDMDCDCDKCTAEMVLAPILALLDQAHNTDDGDHYTALVNSARLTAHAMMRLVQE